MPIPLSLSLLSLSKPPPPPFSCHSPPAPAPAHGTSSLFNSDSLRLPPASKILVKNLSYSTGEASLLKLFSRFGHIVEVKLAKHKETNMSRGYAFLQYSSQDDAMLALENMDRQRIDGRTVYVDIAKPTNFGSADYPKSMGPPSHHNSQANSVEHAEGNVFIDG